MNNTQKDAWFYTREGDRVGPVTLADLRVMAAGFELDPRLDMIWTEGMAGWKPAGEIDGLFGKSAVPEEHEALAPKADPYTPPIHESVEETMRKEGGWLGARRRSFIFAILIFPISWNLLIPVAGSFLNRQFGPEITTCILIGAVFLPAVVAVYFGLMRLVNLGMSRWWLLGMLVPILNFWVGFRTFACPPGYAYHKKIDGTGVFLAIVYGLLAALVIVTIMGIIALMVGAVDNPALEIQIREAIRAMQEPLKSP